MKSGEFPWASGPPEQMKISVGTPAQAGVRGFLQRAQALRARHPRAGGGPCPEELDSRLRGNDMRAVIFRGAARQWLAAKLVQ